jgi:hypothetical protein
VADLTSASTVQSGPLVDEGNALHIVGAVQHYLGRFGVKIPRALCGVSLEDTPDRPEASPDAPTCPMCSQLDGSEGGRFVPGYWCRAWWGRR